MAFSLLFAACFSGVSHSCEARVRRAAALQLRVGPEKGPCSPEGARPGGEAVGRGGCSSRNRVREAHGAHCTRGAGMEGEGHHSAPRGRLVTAGCVAPATSPAFSFQD